MSLVVAWFGDDLRAGQCQVRPKVERRDKTVVGASWSVAGLNRANADLVSDYQGKAAYGGTPSDDTVIRAIRELTRRGLKVTLYPFMMMDIPANNGRIDPRTGEASQPAYPWRGQITCDPAPGRAGTPVGTEALNSQISSFIGTAEPGHFTSDGDRVVYAGPNEWTYRRMVLHMAKLAQIAGGVDSFIIGSEMIGLTHLRGSGSHFPMVASLAALAEDVKAILPSSLLTYAADWTEYGARPEGNNLYFPLDPLWASSAIAAIGLDNYPPLSDWRDGSKHLDRSIASTVYDLGYLQSRITAGRPMIIIMRARLTAKTRSARPSPMVSASPGSSARRICETGGLTAISSGVTGLRPRRQPGPRNPSRSGSRNSVFPPWTRAATSPRSFPIPNPRQLACPIFPLACAMT